MPSSSITHGQHISSLRGFIPLQGAVGVIYNPRQQGGGHLFARSSKFIHSEGQDSSVQVSDNLEQLAVRQCYVESSKGRHPYKIRYFVPERNTVRRLM